MTLDWKMREQIRKTVTLTKRSGTYGFRNNSGTGNLTITVPPSIVKHFGRDARFKPKLIKRGILYERVET